MKFAHLVKYCSNIYKKYGFKFIDSGVSTSFGNSFIILKNDNLMLRFISDRGQLFLDFHSNFDKNKNNWYSIDLVRQLITGEKEYYSLLDEINGRFIKNNFEQILQIFDKDVINQTIEKLNFLRKKRAKKLFG